MRANISRHCQISPEMKHPQVEDHQSGAQERAYPYNPCKKCWWTSRGRLKKREVEEEGLTQSVVQVKLRSLELHPESSHKELKEFKLERNMG